MKRECRCWLGVQATPDSCRTRSRSDLSVAGLLFVADKMKVTPYQYLSIVSWLHFNPEYSLTLFDDNDELAYIQVRYTLLSPSLAPPALTTHPHRSTGPIMRCCTRAWPRPWRRATSGATSSPASEPRGGEMRVGCVRWVRALGEALRSELGRRARRLWWGAVCALLLPALLASPHAPSASCSRHGGVYADTDTASDY